MSRKNPETNEDEKKYVRNVRYMFPKSRTDDVKVKSHLKVNTQVRELFDLTDEAEEDVKVQNLCDVINLDDSDYNHDPEAEAASNFVKSFTSQATKKVFGTCPFCEVLVGELSLAAHFDFCRGYQQKVVYKKSSK